MVHASIRSILDNGNATYGPPPHRLLQKLQKVQNSAVTCEIHFWTSWEAETGANHTLYN